MLSRVEVLMVGRRVGGAGLRGGLVEWLRGG